MAHAQDWTSIRKSEELFSIKHCKELLFETLQDGFGMQDLDGRITYVNQAFCQMSGYSKGELLGSDPSLYLEPKSLELLLEKTAKRAADDDLEAYEVKLARRDGSVRHVRVYPKGVYGPGSQLVGSFALVKDLSDWRAKDLEVKRFRNLLDHATDSIFVIDPKSGRFLDCNTPALDRLGYSRQEITQMRVIDIQAKFKSDFDWDAYVDLIFQRKSLQTTGAHRRKDGSTYPVEVNVNLIELGREPQILAVVRDISERVETESALRESTRKLRRLSERMNEAQEDLSRKIARDLHDDFGQIVAAMDLNFSEIRKRLKKDHGDCKELVTRIEYLANLNGQMLSSIKRISRQLRPIVLDDLGLTAAIEWLADYAKDTFGLEVHLEKIDEIKAHSSLTTALYRICQEGLTNIAKHAHAKNAFILLEVEHEQVHLSIRDDGVGFGCEIKPDSFGLFGLRERIHPFGGSLEIHSEEGGGSKLEAHVPLRH